MNATADGARPAREPKDADGPPESAVAESAGDGRAAEERSEGERPADVARRALWAARGREARGAEAAADQPGAPSGRGAPAAAPATTSAAGARPGDVAREALRRAAATGSAPGPGAAAPVTGPEPDSPEEAAGEGPSAAEATATEVPEGTAGTVETAQSAQSAQSAEAAETAQSAGTVGGARPGDVAREALRAARGARPRERKAAPRRGAEHGRRAPQESPAGSGDPRETRPAAPGNRAQDVRDLLAGAFALPTDDDPAHQPPEAAEAASAFGRPHPGAAPTDPPALPGDGTRALTPRRAPTDAAVALAGTAANTPDETRAVAPPKASAEATEGPAEDAPVRGDETGAVTPPYGADATGATPGDGTRGAPSGTEHAVVPPADVDAPRPARQGSGGSGAPTGGPGQRSMASPGRDGELRRTFPAFPARPADAAGAFAGTWWGNAWVTALEEGALDRARLSRGRGYAERGHVDAITVTPGLVLAYVHGTRARPYRVQVRLRTLDDAAWDRFLDAAVERPGHIAALLDKQLPHSLADCGADLLPGPGDLQPQCSCPDSGHPCKHAAALCYQTARLLDEDPFVLLLLRGRGERELLDALSRRNAARAARAAQEREPAPLPGVRASDALAPRSLPPLPAPLPAPSHPEQPPAYPGAPGGPDPFALDQLATDAAARAHALLTAGRDPVGDLTLWQDAVRLAAARPGSGLTAGTRALYSSLATATRRTPADLARAVAAWRQGGIEGLAVLEETWDPPAGRFDRARPLLLAADLPAFRPWRNHLTHPRGHVQIRLGRDGLWYAYESEPGHDDWWPRGTPDLDPVGALTGLGTSGDL
ncbi:SWIM zinc finger family protein [Streptomyces sp. NPDC005551]|uniref:SWIM zinc finger family protein n=1 Tax=Streptomyces sp. NPDC005551 TaxID=3364725 RepID=UPI0036848D7C